MHELESSAWFIINEFVVLTNKNCHLHHCNCGIVPRIFRPVPRIFRPVKPLSLQCPSHFPLCVDH